MPLAITEAEGASKYDLQYVSQKALKVMDEGVKKGLRHEHVQRRATMVKCLLDHPQQADAILNKARGCVVTIDEHKRLDLVDRANPDADGWQRYRLARIKVYDRSSDRVVSYDELIEQAG